MKNRRERKKQVRRKKVANLASYSRRYTVNNTTIKNTEIDYVVGDDGNGKKWSNPSKDYTDIKNRRIEYLKAHFNSKHRRNIPWFILTYGKQYNYEERKASFGMHTDYFRVPSEQKIFHDKYTLPKMNCVEYMEKLVQHKLAKWERKNPCPVKTDGPEKDLFEAEYLPNWKHQREKAEERIRDFVVSVYDKLQLTGRYERNDNEFYEQEVTKLKDVDGEGHKINELDPKKSKLLKKAKKITNTEKKRKPNLVSTNLKDHKKKKGRIILPDSQLQKAA